MPRPRRYEELIDAKFRVSITRRAQRVFVQVFGELDLAARERFADLLLRLPKDSVKRVTLDLGELSFIDSTGIRAITAFCDTFRDAGIDVELFQGPPAVRRVFEVTGLIAVLPFVEQPSNQDANDNSS
jgi:anti-anti-sigma factor